MPSHKKSLINVRALCKDFRRPNGNLFPVLESINLEVYDGEFLALLGLSGSGKSTLLRCMAGLLTPDRGAVSYIKPPEGNKQPLSFVFQNYALFPWLTVRENIEVALLKFSSEEKQGRVERMLELVGLKGYEDAYPRELSGGMRQRVSFCRGMVADPMVMFLDEPFGALDPLTGESLRAEIERLWTLPDRKIRSIVLVTHSLDEAVQLADRIVIMSSNPGTIFRTIEVPLVRPRNPGSPEYKAMQEIIEKTFGELHLNKLDEELNTEVHMGVTPSASTEEDQAIAVSSETRHQRKLRPLINTSLVLVEGLINRLQNETEPMDLYDLADNLGQSVDQMLPAVASAEMLGFVTTPGTLLDLTPIGRVFAQEQDAKMRRELIREALLKLPIVASIHDKVCNSRGGLERHIALEMIVMMLPFEDHDQQFDALLKWTRYANLLNYDAGKELLFVAEDD